MRKYLFLSFILSLLSLTSCYENKIETAEKAIFNKPTENVRVYTKAETNYIAETVTGTTVDFSSSTPDDILPKKGEIIQMPISERTPNGFLGKVTSVEKEGSVITVTTEQVALDEAYPNLSIDTTFNIIDGIEGVFDEDGNPVEYTIEREENAQTRAAAEFDWKEGRINIPIPTDLLGKEFSATGSIKVSFAGSKFDLDNKDGLRYLNLELHPSLSLSASITTKINGPEKTEKIFQTKPLKIKARAVVGPVIIPITIPISFKAGVKGEMTSTLELNYTKACNAYVRYQDEKWFKGCEPIKTDDESPWFVSSFDVNGSLYAGLNVEFIAGIYTTNAGIGFELFPNASLSAKASLSSIDPFKTNPEVSFGIGLQSRVFCIAKLFSKNLELFDIKLPEKTFFQRKLSLFPNINEFNVTGGSSSAEISYISNSYYFLQAFGFVKTGTTIYEKDKETEVRTLYPAHHKIDNLGNRYYNTDVTELQAGTTYYAAPIISCLNFKWSGEKKEFSTEASYHAGFRCANTSYDNIYFDFSIAEGVNSSLDQTLETQDYDGDLERIHFTAHYDASTKTLNGVIDYHFYDNPDEKRQDGFTITLPVEDTGYIYCTKVIDNGGCNKMVRVYRNSSASARSKRYSAPIVIDDCNSGDH